MRKTFGDRFKLFEKNMKTFQELKAEELGEFGLKKKIRVTIKNVEYKLICIEDAKAVLIASKDDSKGENIMKEKVAIKFRHVEGNEPVGESSYFISGSPSLKDRALKAQHLMPFLGTIEKEGKMRKYYVIK